MADTFGSRSVSPHGGSETPATPGLPRKLVDKLPPEPQSLGPPSRDDRQQKNGFRGLGGSFRYLGPTTGGATSRPGD